MAVVAIQFHLEEHPPSSMRKLDLCHFPVAASWIARIQSPTLQIIQSTIRNYVEWVAYWSCVKSTSTSQWTHIFSGATFIPRGGAICIRHRFAINQDLYSIGYLKRNSSHRHFSLLSLSAWKYRWVGVQNKLVAIWKTRVRHKDKEHLFLNVSCPNWLASINYFKIQRSRAH